MLPRVLLAGVPSIISLMVLGAFVVRADDAQPAAESTVAGDAAAWKVIDNRPTPEWWQDAKFGIFIHWGVYSVPAFSEIGNYAEWYWRDLADANRGTHAKVKSFHDRVYGERFTYPDFVPRFTCELFDPNQWAQTFKDSGAKYVVLTSKHHDGYCLWPSQQADLSWGRPWCSTNSGPGRDLLGELTAAVRKTPVKMGIYYSLYEWYNPLYQADVNLFVERHMIPQFKDVVTRYKPSVIFSDGEWDHPAETWRSTELLTWLLNESPCRDEVVINDRWGKGDRHKHGGYFTTEYGAGLPDAKNLWEESRGMAHSYGYSRTERFADYNSTETLLLMLIDIVSRGGNFLLDIGPTADGRIPAIMEQRLIEMGDWLKVNGEAIYGTRTHTTTCQWTAGEIQRLGTGDYRVPYDVQKLLKFPPQGMARKEALFTRKGDTLFAICAVYPDDQLVLHDVKAATGATVTLLGYGAVEWKQTGDDLVITVPAINPSRMPCQHAWTFRVSRIVGSTDDRL